MKSKIGLVTLRSPPAILTGSERFMWYVAKYLSKYFYIEFLTSNLVSLLDILSPKRTNRILPASSVYDGIKIRRFKVYNQLAYPFKLPVTPLKNVRTFQSIVDVLSSWTVGPTVLGLYNYIKSNKFDLIHATPMPYTHVLISQRVSQKLNIPFVVTPFYHYKLGMLNKYQIRIISRSNMVTVCTNFERKKLVEKGITSEKIKKIPMGIDPQKYRTNSTENLDTIKEKYNFEDKLVILTSARMFFKGTYDIIKALELLKLRYNFVLVTIGPEDRNWKYIKEKHDIPLLDLGIVDETIKNQIFSSCDIFCLPSIADTFGISYLEAWIFEKPVIGARIEVMEEIIRDGYDGLLVKFGDYKDLAQKLEILLTDDSLRKMYGKRGRRKVLKYYTWDKITKKIADVYHELLGE